MRSIKTVLILIAIVLVASLLATSMAYSADRRGGGQNYGGDHRGGGQNYGGDHRGGGHYGSGYYGGRYYGGGHYYGSRFWRPWRYYPRFYPRFYPSYYPSYYPYAPYYYPYYNQYYNTYPAVIAPSTPQTYIERDQEESDSEPGPEPSGVWYYCPGPKAYYPYVKECPGGWQTLPAEPPAEPGR